MPTSYSAAQAVLNAWGAYRRNEVDREVNYASPFTAAVRSGQALEVLPDSPPLTLTDEEAQRVGHLISEYYLPQSYRNAIVRHYWDQDFEWQRKKSNLRIVQLATCEFAKLW